MSQQITEAHKLVEEARRIAGFPALLHRFLDTAAEAIVIVNKDGTIVFFNRRATFMFGWEAGEAVGKQVEMLLPDSIQQMHAEVHRKGYMEEPYTRAMGANLDLKAKHKDGTEFSVLIDLHPEMGTDGPYVRAAIRRREIQQPAHQTVPRKAEEETTDRGSIGGSCPRDSRKNIIQIEDKGK
jgi:PAS domain S-box-containing protein